MGDPDHHRSLVTSMERELQLVESSPSQTDSSTVYRVPKTIRENDMKAYEPQIISIGPYHRNNPRLQAMEAYKWKSLSAMLHRNPNSTLEDYITRIQLLENQARSHYSEEIDMGSDDFVKMMVLDGCFVVEVLLNTRGIEETNQIRPIGDANWTMAVICRDMILLENQLPFFVIQQLFDLLSYNSLSLVDLAFHFFKSFIPLNRGIAPPQFFHHLLHLVHASLLPSRSSIPLRVDGTDHRSPYAVWIPSAMEIRRAGIRFREKDNPNSLMDVTFDKNRVIEIPRLSIQDFTNALLRNAIAFEQCHLKSGFHVASYVLFMSCLLTKPKDVELLVENRIIEHWSVNHEAVVVLFNGLSRDLVLDWTYFHFSHLFADVAHHCDRAWNRWQAVLRRDYFSTPQAVVEFQVTAFTILFTVLQTVIAVVAYYRPQN